MASWVIRPGRVLATLDGLALWPLLLGFGLCVMWVPQLGLLGLAVAFVGPALFASAVVATPTRIDRFQGASGNRWLFRSFGLLILMALGLELPQWGAYLVLASVLASAVGATMRLAVSMQAQRWISGRLELDEDGAKVRSAGAVYLLHHRPRHCSAGSYLSFPFVHLERTSSGPYRSGRASGRAPIVLHANAPELATRLRAQGLGLMVWALTSFVFACSVLCGGGRCAL